MTTYYIYIYFIVILRIFLSRHISRCPPGVGGFSVCVIFLAGVHGQTAAYCDPVLLTSGVSIPFTCCLTLDEARYLFYVNP